MAKCINKHIKYLRVLGYIAIIEFVILVIAALNGADGIIVNKFNDIINFIK